MFIILLIVQNDDFANLSALAGDVAVVKFLLDHKPRIDLQATVYSTQLTTLELAEKLMTDNPEKNEYKQIYQDLNTPRNTSTQTMTFHY